MYLTLFLESSRNIKDKYVWFFLKQFLHLFILWVPDHSTHGKSEDDGWELVLSPNHVGLGITLGLAALVANVFSLGAILLAPNKVLNI